MREFRGRLAAQLETLWQPSGEPRQGVEFFTSYAHAKHVKYSKTLQNLRYGAASFTGAAPEGGILCIRCAYPLGRQHRDSPTAANEVAKGWDNHALQTPADTGAAALTAAVHFYRPL